MGTGLAPGGIVDFAPGRAFDPPRRASRPWPPEAIRRSVIEPERPVFRRAVIALTGGSGDERVVHLACELARPIKAELVGVYVAEIEWSLPLDAEIASGSEDAQRVLDLAEGIAERHHMRLETVLLQARDVGAALVDEASERGADLLILSLAYRQRFGGDFAIGRTIPYVLKNAPCAVWVVREPIPEETP
jgi:nucleotide-binding universal stress UspA family protein